MIALRAVIGDAPTSSSGVRRYHLGAEIHGQWALLAEIDVMTIDWDGVDEDGEAMIYWDPPREGEPYMIGTALSCLYYAGECPSGRKIKDAPAWRKFNSLWGAVCGAAQWYGWDLEVEGFPEDES